MPGELPDGEAVPRDGALPPAALEASGRRGFGVYVHVPFCASRCGYCDFNTYTATELGGGASRDEYAETVLAELRLASRVMTKKPEKVDTVFVGGGTPTLLAADDLVRILEAIDDTWGLAPGAEVTTEANPESVDLSYLRTLRRGGFTRISLGMQSTAPGVLRILERQHSAGRAPAAAIEAREAGFEHVNLDLIYGTPGETADDFARSLDAVVAAGVDHVSAYALIVEDGTRLAARMRRGELPYPDDDVAADRYLAADRALTAAGLSWYEVSNWAATPEARCRHNLLYWTGGDWWGLGPGAHSHVGGVRWWNVKHPSAYAKRLAAGETPALARELLTEADRHMEDVMLRVRLAEGLPLATLDEAGRAGAKDALSRGLLEPAAYDAGRIVLTLPGRLLADGVVRDLLT
ncbi:oxygen-independent coproporphyrinogen-3 oxidase [Catenuloplanes nepalensis]|uniref:Heme chaperone HemW n=1 Tax=Catenuloplanes nepalensis TaxID=587533 RepID=A0ABT9MJE7_9ACTN|nr:radical SAM family heme chaperone HemW [Catenuloplanes nepalensis]MDP9791547.1 oxygen-independent coproporphyrinogen-3 oxidase [Catenuloplanes nepalensis]